MPNRAAVNKYELFLAEIRKVSKKRDLQGKDNEIKERAILIAALSSRSWKTYRYMHDGAEFDKVAIMNEAQCAFSDGWREISEREIEEVVNSDIREDLLSMWSFYVFGKDQRQKFLDMLRDVKNDFIDGIEPLEISSSNE